MYRLNRGPAPMLDLVGAATFRAVALALELDLFAALDEADGPLDAAALADRLGADADGVDRLCGLLAETGYLARRGGGYRLTSMTETWLLGGDSLADFFRFWDELAFPFWERELGRAVREGAPSRTLYDWCDERPERWAVAQAGFRSAAALLADDVADAVSVPDGAGRLLDVGGGHGLYSYALLRRHPGLSATIVDGAAAVEAVRDDVPDDLADRVSLVAGDYRTDDLGEGFDLALVFNVVHAQDPDGNRALLGRVADALAPGGRVAVLDQWAGSGRSPVSRAALRFIGLTYLVTLDADVYSLDAVADWLREAGYVDVRRRGVGPLSGLAVVEATVPAA